jgi:hypothetical protein
LLFFHGQTGFASVHCLLGQCLPYQLRDKSLVFVAFPTSLFTTIPCSDFSPSIVYFLSIAALKKELPPTVEMMRSPWVTFIAFHSKPVLITNKIQSGIGRPHFMQGYPILLANMVTATCSELCLQVLRTKSHDTRTTCQLYISATTGC